MQGLRSKGSFGVFFAFIEDPPLLLKEMVLRSVKLSL